MSLRSLLIDPAKPIIHRDLSWLQFNERVLAEAKDKTNPLLERLRFLAITSSNLDEFFMIRFASLQRDISSLEDVDENQVQRLEKIESTILGTIHKFKQTQERTFEQLRQELSAFRIFLHHSISSGTPEYARAEALFKSQLAGHFDKPVRISKRALKSLDNLSMALIFSDNTLVPLKPSMPGFVVHKLTSKNVEAFVSDKLLVWFSGKHFGKSESPLLLRLTRDADVNVVLDRDDPESIPDQVVRTVKTRSLRKAVRLQYRGVVNTEALRFVAEAFKIDEGQIYPVSHPLQLHKFYSFIDQVRDRISFDDSLVYPPLKQKRPKWTRKKENVFSRLKKRDFVLHHPYDSFEGYVSFLEEAVRDKQVKSIQQTVYRVDAVSEARSLLLEAARKKQVRVFIEPRARFDEINNIQLAEDLKKAGAEVVFPQMPLKMHAKMALVTRKEGDKLVNYTHLSTGNYNAKTARQYEDFAILTGHQGLGQDATRFFDIVARGQIPSKLKYLVIAPTELHKRISVLIRQEVLAAQAGFPANIFAKVNALVDEKVIFELYEASRAGVEVNLVVRGACSLIPKTPGLSDNIKVYSVVDRFLEHSRIYYFQNTGNLYLSSADWMPRNFFSRLEIAFPVLDPKIFSFIEEVAIPLYLKDRFKARTLNKDGVWRSRYKKEGGTRAQEEFIRLVKENYRGTPLE